MFVSPMLLHKVDEPFDDENYITELKLDGFRCIWTKFEDKVRIYTRHNNEITSLFPELQSFPIPNGTVVDGEIIVTDSEGKPDFEAVMERFKSKKSNYEVSFSVFDVIYYNNQKVTHIPLLGRKELLNEIILEDTPKLNKVQWILGNALQYYELVKQQDLEGIVMKKDSSKYQIKKRSSDWLKVINYKYTDVKIAGIRKNEFGVLLKSMDDKYVGVMEFMTPEERKKLYKIYRDHAVGEDEKFVYLDSKLKIKVKFRNYTKKGLLRIPSFLEWLS